jgi:streptogramin lyase
MQRQHSALLGMALLAFVLEGCGGTGTATGSPGTPGGTATPPAATPTTQATSAAPPTRPPGVTAIIDTDFQASGILAAGDLLWAEDHASTQKVYALDPETGEVAGTVDLGRPCDLVAVGDEVWAVDLGAGKIVAIDPATFEIVGEVGGMVNPCGPQFVDGSIWLAADPGIGRIDPEAKTLAVTDLGGGTFPGAGTPLWAAEFGLGTLHRIDTRSGKSILEIEPPGGPAELIWLTVAFDSLWASNERGGIFRLDPVTGAIETEIDMANPSRVLATTAGIWFTSYLSGLVGRIDPATNEVVYQAHLGGNVNGITEGFGSIWVSDTASGRLLRIDPVASGITD